MIKETAILFPAFILLIIAMMGLIGAIPPCTREERWGTPTNVMRLCLMACCLVCFVSIVRNALILGKLIQ